MTDAEKRRIWLKLQRWREHPITMAREEFGFEPDPWQAKILEEFPHYNRHAMKACKGPGKTALLAILILNFLATRPFPRIAAVSITGDNLKQNLWPELAKWMNKSEFCRNTFTWTKSEITHNQHSADWWCQARAFSKKADQAQQADALAGLHADYAMAVLDESGGIPQAVMATAEAVLASGIETKVVQSGNPTHTTGPLHRACTQDRALWRVTTITADPDDPMRSTRVSKEWAQQQITQYGRDNPWVLVNVFGQFPPASIDALLGVEEVEAAMRRHLPRDVYQHSQKRLGVDVARFGDDRTVIAPRQGLAVFMPEIMRTQRTTTIAARVARYFQSKKWRPEIALIDDSGHWGHGVVDALLTANFPVIPILGEAPAPSKKYKNNRAYSWLKMADAVRAGAALPPIPELIPELTVPTYTFLGGQFVLEDKKHIKERLGFSPDIADAISETYALPDQPAGVLAKIRNKRKSETEFDPYALDGVDQAGTSETEFDPEDY